MYNIDTVNFKFDKPGGADQNHFRGFTEMVFVGQQEGDDTMTRNLEKKLADAKALTEQVAKLDRTSQVYILGEITARLLCAKSDNKTA